MSTVMEAVKSILLRTGKTRPLSDEDVRLRLSVLMEILRREDGIGQIKRLLTDRSPDFDGVAPDLHVAQVLDAAVRFEGLGGAEAARLAVTLSEIRNKCAMDVIPYLSRLRERFPVECEDGNLLAVEVLEA